MLLQATRVYRTHRTALSTGLTRLLGRIEATWKNVSSELGTYV